MFYDNGGTIFFVRALQGRRLLMPSLFSWCVEDEGTYLLS